MDRLYPKVRITLPIMVHIDHVFKAKYVAPAEKLSKPKGQTLPLFISV